MSVCRLVLFAAWLAAIAGGARAEPPDARQLARFTNDGQFKQRPRWSADGRLLIYARHRGDTIFLHLRDLATGDERRLTQREAPEYDAVFSPDSRRVVFAFDKTSPNQGDLEVYSLQLDSGELAPVAVSEGGLSHEESPDWSPDGKQIVFSSTKPGNQELFATPAAGGEWTRLTTDPAIDAHPAWSPDGRSIAFATNRWGDLEIALMDADGGNVRRFTQSRGLDDYPVWSPDGRQLAFTSNRDGNHEIYVADVASGQAVNCTRNAAWDNFPAWLPDGRLGYVSNRDGGFDVYAQPVERQP